MLKFNGDLSKAPYDKKLLVVLKDGTIHTTQNSRGNGWFPMSVSDEIGRYCAYDCVICGWIDLNDLEYEILK